MLLIYCLQDACEWAEFSGDTNPIHFEPERAQEMGMDTLTVHGMRALFDMKNYLNRALLPQASNDANYHFSARLRHSVKYHVLHELSEPVLKKDMSISNKLINTHSNEICFSGKVNIAPLSCPQEVSLKYTMANQQYRNLCQQFTHRKTGHLCEWAIQDALLFRCIVYSPDILMTLHEVLPELQATTLNDVFEKLPIVQTHHEVDFNGQTLRDHDPLSSEAEFRYGLQPALVLGDRSKGFIIRFSCQGGFSHDELVTTSITLKTRPITPSCFFK